MLFRLVGAALALLICKGGITTGTSPPLPELEVPQVELECDPKTINFHKVAYNTKPNTNIEVDQILGSWYAHRYYLALGYTVSDHYESYSTYMFTKAGHPNTVFRNRYGRDKLEDCCSDLDDWKMTELSNGIYSIDTGYPKPVRSTILYASSQFMVELFCEVGEEQSCADYSVLFWSRCKKARPQDVAKGEHILRKLCYPHMKRFVCQDHYDVDCHEAPIPPNLCGCPEPQVETDACDWQPPKHYVYDHHEYKRPDKPKVEEKRLTAEDVLATRKQINVLDSFMSYLDTGGDDKPVAIFLHGIPATSFLWRNVIPEVAPVARCVALDLLGMGYSGKNPANSYLVVDHYKYFSAWIDAMKFKGKLHFVIHDLGLIVGLHWANNHRNRVGSITFMEGPVAPFPRWELWPEALANLIRGMRSPAGEEMVLNSDALVKQFIVSGVMRNLTAEELDGYLRTLMTRESRIPALASTRQIPVENDGPEETVAMATSYYEWLKTSKDIPKLYLKAEPGLHSEFITEDVAGWPNLKTVAIKGIHFIEEDSPKEIGKAVKDFIKQH